MRAGETDGVHYFFRTEEEFRRMIEQDELLEHACYCNHYYGTPRAFVEEKLAAGVHVLLEIDTQGARQIRRSYPDALLVFIMPPDAQELRRRLTGRGTEEKAVIRERLQRAAGEADVIEEYDYILVNDQPDACARRLHELIGCQQYRVSRNAEQIRRIRSEIKAFESV